MNEMRYDQKYSLVLKHISIFDYNRALFVLRNMDKSLRVRKNIFQFYDNAEIEQCANHIITNYNMPNYTFDKMSEYVDDKFTARMLEASIPYWRRAVFAYVLSYLKQNPGR